MRYIHSMKRDTQIAALLGDDLYGRLRNAALAFDSARDDVTLNAFNAIVREIPADVADRVTRLLLTL